MTGFLGRERELALLNEAYQKHGFAMASVTGRQGIGKTTLLHEFCRDKRRLFLSAKELKLERNLEDFTKEVLERSGMPDFGSMISSANLQMLMAAIGRMAESRAAGTGKLVVVIDGFTCLSQADEAFLPDFLRLTEYELSNKDLFFVVIGEIPAKQSLSFPLLRIRLEPFDYRTAALFTPSFSEEAKLLTYGVTGGIPGYLVLFDQEKPAMDHIRDLFFSVKGTLLNETENLLRQYYRNVALYQTLITVIARGAGRMNEIAKASYYETPVISPAMKKLIAAGIVKKELSILNEDSKRDSVYRISDSIFRFYYSFVSPGRSAVERGEGADYLETVVKPALSDYMAVIFAEVCRQYTLLHWEGEGSAKEAGEWRRKDPATGISDIIDVVAVCRALNTARIGSCRYRKGSVEPEAVEKLEEKGRMLHIGVEKLYMFSSGGFYPSCLRKYRDDTRVELVTLKDLYEI